MTGGALVVSPAPSCGWLAARDALAQASTACGSEVDGQAELVRHAAAGRVIARAETAIVHLGGRFEREHEEESYPLPHGFWIAGTRALGNWQLGTFQNEVSLPGSLYPASIQAFGVQFERAGVERCFPMLTSAPSSAVVEHVVPRSDRTGGQGRPTSGPIYLALLRRRHESGVTLPHLSAECREIAAMFDADPANAGLARCQPRALENMLRDEYRAIKSAH